MRERARSLGALGGVDTATIKTIHAFAASALGVRESWRARTLPGASTHQAVTDVLTAEAFDDASSLWKRGKNEGDRDDAQQRRLARPRAP